VKRVECPDTVWVSQLTKENTEAELKKAFSKYGEIENIFLHKTKYFSYITFQNAEQAKKAIKNLNGTMIGNASIKVQARRPLIHSAELNVKNISAQTTFKSLVDLFSKAGDLQSVQLFQLDQNDAYAIVAFNTVDEASKAVELNGTTLDDRALTIQYQRRKKSEQERFTKLSKYRR
jgi:RNA recognition motif-containing protein